MLSSGMQSFDLKEEEDLEQNCQLELLEFELAEWLKVEGRLVLEDDTMEVADLQTNKNKTNY